MISVLERRSALVAIDTLRSVNAIHLLPIAYSHLGINLAGMGKFSLAAEYHQQAVPLPETTLSLCYKPKPCVTWLNATIGVAGFWDCKQVTSTDSMRCVTASIRNPQLAIAGQLCFAEEAPKL